MTALAQGLRAALATVLVTWAAAAQAADTYSGTASLAGENAAFTQGLGFWKAGEGEASIGLFGKAPDAAFQAKALKEGFFQAGWQGSFLVLDLRFTKGAPQASTTTFGSCHIGFYEFKARSEERRVGKECRL